MADSGIDHYLASSGQRALYSMAQSTNSLYAAAMTPIAAYSSNPAPLYTPGTRTLPGTQFGYSGRSSASQFGYSEQLFTGRRPYGMESRSDKPSEMSAVLALQVERDRHAAEREWNVQESGREELRN